MPVDPFSIALILPYFGPLPNYADLFFASCAANPTVNWLFITDQAVDQKDLPVNVILQKATFTEFRRSLNRVLDFQTGLRTPYKLVDFKPAYGVICRDAIRRFAFWGHCDMDVIFGSIRTFVTNDILERYDKLFIHGHFSLYRNREDANRYFTLEAPGISFRQIFRSPKPAGFDEFEGIKKLLEHHKVPMFRADDYIADINPNSYRMWTEPGPNNTHQCFYWDAGRVFREFWDGDRPDRQEYMYIHLQKRRMSRPLADFSKGRSWFITPERFIPRQAAPLSPEEMDRLNPRDLLFDMKRRAASLLWNAKKRLLDATRSRYTSTYVSGGN